MTTVDLWTGSLDLPRERLAELTAFLSPDERDRAAAFRTPLLRSRYVAARGQLREVLSSYLAVPAVRIRFDYQEHGRPELSATDDAQRSLRFNLSHADAMVAVAVTPTARVGVDIERIAPHTDLRDVAHQNFSDAELHEIASLPAELFLHAFYACWTLKEAYLKAVGWGLMAPLKDFDVSVNPGRIPALRRVGDDIAAGERWSMIRFSPGDGFVGAVAVEEPNANVRMLTLGDEGSSRLPLETRFQ